METVMAGDPGSLFEVVRKSCSPAIWSRGIELTRANAVVGERIDDDEAVFRITTRGGMICPQVTLFPEDEDWDCECANVQGACEHVAAAVIAWRRASDDGRDPTEVSAAVGRVGYRFSRVDGGLVFERAVVCDGAWSPLRASLSAIAAGRVDGPRFQATQADLAADVALGIHRRGSLPGPMLPKLFACLSRCREIELDGEPVEVEAKLLLPRARLEDDGEGFRLWVEEDPSIQETFPNGVVLADRTLRLTGHAALTAREREDYERGSYFGPDAVGDLVVEVLPSLRRRLPVLVNTDRLPQTVHERPRVRIEIDRDGERLNVLATLVYGDPPTARIDGGRLVHLSGPVPVRDPQVEKVELRRLAHLGLAPGVRAEFVGAQAVRFRSSLADWQTRVRGEGLDHFALAPPITPRLELDGSKLDVAFESTVPPGSESAPARRSSADPGAVLRAWRSGESLVPLLGGGWAPIPADWLTRYGDRLADLLAARDASGSVPRCCLPDLADLCEVLDQPPPPEFEGMRRIVGEFVAVPESPLPNDLQIELRSYQRAGVDWLAFLRDAGLGAMLADDMGLGKTLQALCALRPRALVVVPTSVLLTWVDELERSRPGLSYSVYHGPKRQLDPDADLILTTYAILRLDADRLAEEHWRTVVLDEAQNIKNPDSQVARAAYGLQADCRMTLTGTPVENRLEELWSQFHFTNRGLLGGRTDFQERYAVPIGRGDAGAADRLRARIRPFIMRRLKSEVARELPPRTDMVLRCELSPGEREVYDTIRAATMRDVVQRLQSGGSVLKALEALLRMRQAACHSALIPGQSAEGSSKLEVLLEALDNVVAEGRKALVFSQWTSLLDLAEPHLKRGDVGYVRLDGSTRDRAGVVRAFQEDGGPPVLLVSLKAGGTGLNLTAADHIFLLDPWWNPAVEDQAADRAHRIGQDQPVMVYRIVAADTVEEKILALQQRKRGLAEAALGGAEGAAPLSRDDLLELLL
jgi:superfamily II DNA or RNA helicase